jgi:hypothetical protein
MQESPTIEFDPMYEGQLPWSTRLFVIYLAVLLLVFCFRAVRMLWHLRSLRNAAQETSDQLDSRFWLAWDSCHARTVSLKNWSALTFLLSFLVSAWSMTGTLRGISMQKVTGTSFLAGAFAEVLMAFCFGMLACTALYAFAFFYETLLMRYKLQRSPRRH